MDTYKTCLVYHSKSHWVRYKRKNNRFIIMNKYLFSIFYVQITWVLCLQRMYRSRSIILDLRALQSYSRCLDLNVKNCWQELNNRSGKLQLFGTLEAMKFWIIAHFILFKNFNLSFPSRYLFPPVFKNSSCGVSLCVLQLNTLNRVETSFED